MPGGGCQVLDQVFPPEVVKPVADTPDIRGFKHALVELNKANTILFFWLVLTIPAMWIGGGTGGNLLSITVALTGVAFSKTQSILNHSQGDHFNTLGTLVLWCLGLPILAGLVVGNQSMKDDVVTATASVTTGISSVLLLFLFVNLLKKARWPVQELHIQKEKDSELKKKPKSLQELAAHNLQKNPNLSVPELLEKTKADRNADKDLEESEEDEQPDLQLLISIIMIITALILAILGTGTTWDGFGPVLEDASMNLRLSFLGISIAFSIMASQFCAILDEHANGGPVIEFLNTLLSLTADILPLILELSFTEDADNPNTMTTVAWVGFGSGLLFWCLSAYSVKMKRNARREIRHQEQKKEDEFLKKAFPSGQPGLEQVAASAWVEGLEDFDMDVEVFKEDIFDKPPAQLEAWEKDLEREEKDLKRRLEEVEEQTRLIQDERARQGRGIPIEMTEPAPQVFAPPPVKDEYLFVPQGYYPEAQPSSGPLPATVPVQWGVYKTQPPKANVDQQAPGQMMPGTPPIPGQQGMPQQGMPPQPGMPHVPGAYGQVMIGSAAPSGV